MDTLVPNDGLFNGLFNGDECHGIESVKQSPTFNKSKLTKGLLTMILSYSL